MIDSLLRAFGLRTGRYTSPHLESVTERICLNGLPLEPEAVCPGLRRHRAVRRSDRPAIGGRGRRAGDVLRAAHRDGVRGFRRRAGRRRRDRGRPRRHLGRHQRAGRAGRRRDARCRSTTRSCWDETTAEIARREGRDHHAWRPPSCSPSSRWRQPRCCCGGRSSRRPRSLGRDWSSACSPGTSRSAGRC